MARVTHTDHAKCTVWTPTIKMEFAGPRLACAIEMFHALDVEKMPKALEHMQKIYEDRKVKSETKGATDASENPN